MIHICGDTHGLYDQRKLDALAYQYKATPPTEQVYLIILGDAGIVFNPYVPDGEEKKIKKWYHDRPWTTLFVDGNHENFDRLYDLPTEPMFGGTVSRYSEKIIWLRRGEIYNIDGHKFFVMGGAVSVDRASRIEGKSWWSREVPSHAEFEYGLDNLDKHDNKVDYILAHNCPVKVSLAYMRSMNIQAWMEPKMDAVGQYLDVVSEKTEFKKFYYGHWHDDWDYMTYTDEKEYQMLYQKIINLKKKTKDGNV